MKVYPISSSFAQKNSNQKPCFKGEFIQTKALNELMKESNPGGIIRFRELVEQIKKVPDNVVYWVNKRTVEHETHGPDTYFESTFSVYKQTGDDINTRKWVWSIYDNIPDRLKLHEINREIEDYYGNKITMETKDNLMNQVNELLVQDESFDLITKTHEE